MGRVVAIGIDAAESTLIKRLIQQHDLPHLGMLWAQGASGRIESPSDIGSGAVWPTFTTGTNPGNHGMYSFWDWDAQTMRVAPVQIEGLRPFWHETARAGYSVGVLDVPFTSPVGLPGGIEITEWGAHDAVRRKTEILPLPVHDLVLSAGGRHPFSIPPLDAWASTHDAAGREALLRDCLAGIAQRGRLIVQLISQHNLDLCIAVFTEVHRASHLLWHSIEPDEEHSNVSELIPASGPNLIDVYRAVDREIGRILDALGTEDTLLVFSLHGMRRTDGVPAVLDDLLRRWGVAVAGTWKTESWSRRGQGALDCVRRRLPAPVKKAYHQLTPPSVTIRVAGPPELLDYDWTQTAAFALPTDQHGWIRMNLVGREACGIVAPDRYDQTCTHIEHLLRGLVSNDGQPVVQNVLRLASESGPRAGRLPDLVVHWNDAAIGPGSSLRSPAIPFSLRATHFSGQHAFDGFFVVRAGTEQIERPGPSINAKDLHLLIRRLLSTSDA